MLKGRQTGGGSTTRSTPRPGSGTWGTFDAAFAINESATTIATLRVYAVSMKGGSPIDEVDLHLAAGPGR